jgi:hypothetical protein
VLRLLRAYVRLGLYLVGGAAGIALIMAWFELSLAGKLVSIALAAAVGGGIWWRATRPALPRAALRRDGEHD